MRLPTRAAALSLFSMFLFGAPRLLLAQDQPKVGVTIGYNALHVSTNPCTDCDWNWYPFGFVVDAAVPIADRWQGVGEFSWARHSFHEDPARHVGGLNAISAAGGIRTNLGKHGRFSPFAQVLAGLHRDSSDGSEGVGLSTFSGPGIPNNSFMLQPGAGVVIPLNAARGVVGVAQLDYRRVFTDDAINAMRVVLGFRIGH